MTTTGDDVDEILEVPAISSSNVSDNDNDNSRFPISADDQPVSPTTSPASSLAVGCRALPADHNDSLSTSASAPIAVRRAVAGAGNVNVNSPAAPSPTPSPPREGLDGGWGWVVVASSVFVDAVVDGVCNSLGVFYNTFMTTFAASQAQTSLVSSLLQGVPLVMGPVASMAVNSWGCRNTALLGVVVALAAFMVATLAQTIDFLITTYGFLAGVGFGFLYMPSVVIVGYYFHRRRALALGITCCGSGVGTMVFVPLLAVAKDNHGWRAATYVIVGLLVLCLVACLAYRPVREDLTPPSDTSQPPSRRRRKLTSFQMSVVLAATSASSLKLERALLEESSDSFETWTCVSGDSSVKQPEQPEQPSRQLACHVPLVTASESDILRMALQPGPGPAERREVLFAFGDVRPHPSRPSQDLLADAEVRGRPERPRWAACKWGESSAAPSTEPAEVAGCSYVANEARRNRPRLRPALRLDLDRNVNRPAALSASWHSLRSSPQKPTPGQGPDANMNVANRTANVTFKGSKVSPTDVLNVATKGKQTEGCCEGASRHCRCRCWSPLRSYLSLLANPSFGLYSLCCFLMSVAMYVPITFLPPLAEELGYSVSQSSLLISMTGVGNIIARLLSGLIADKLAWTSLPLSNWSLILGGLLTCLLPHITSYPLLMTYALGFGLCIGTFVTLQVVILIDLLGLHHLTSAFGLVNLFHGIGTFLGPPLQGYIWSTSGDINKGFYVIGALLTLSGVVCIPLQYMPNRRKRPWN